MKRWLYAFGCYVLASLFCAVTQGTVFDNFETGDFKPDWASTDKAAIQHAPGDGAGSSDYYAVVTGASASKDALGGYLGEANGEQTFADFSIGFDFRFTDTNQRQMNIQIGPADVATNNNTGSNIFINFAYDGADDRFEAYSGSWKVLTGLPTRLANNTWHRVEIVGQGFGTADAAYTVTVNGSTQTGITVFHGTSSATGKQAGGFNFNDRYGSNPGFAVDNVSAVGVMLPGILVTETAGSTKVYEAGVTSDTFMLALASPPQSPVTLALTLVESPEQVLLDKSILTFDVDNFDVPQPVTVTAVDDAAVETYLHRARIAVSVVSSDAGYNGLAVDDISITVVDDEAEPSYLVFSGIYPHLAVTNKTGKECGIGAIVDWAGSLWYVTYTPHSPNGSSGDKLYQLDPDLSVTVRPESIGGTPANRMIHPESNQLIISNYFIDENANVRTIPFSKLYGRMTANARHLTDPANQVYFFTMEDGLYEVNVNTLDVTELHRDRNHGGDDMVPGDHGKGAYTGQGRLVVANNGKDSGGNGTLSEWFGVGDPDIRSSWKEIDRNKYTDVTGPGGIYGNLNETDPLWSMGWDHKSVLLQVCDRGVWKRFRLPKGSYTQDDADGWYTEWPRIRKAAPERLMMDMHCILYEFPIGFSHTNTAGILPLSTHLKMIVDWQYWDDRLVLACNDISPFGSGLLGGITQSNLRFTTMDELDELGRPVGWGGPWVEDKVTAGQPSEAFLINGFSRRAIHFAHNKASAVNFTIEIDRQGNDQWTAYDTVSVGPRGYGYYILPSALQAHWVRFKSDATISEATVYLHCSSDQQKLDATMFGSLAAVDSTDTYSAGILHPINSSALELEFSADIVNESGDIVDTGYYVIGEGMALNQVIDSAAASSVRSRYQTSRDFSVDAASVIVGGYRLPKADPSYDVAMPSGWPRGRREVVTERYLMNIHGSFYEYPRNLDGTEVLRKIRPITTHNKKIFDFCSWRGMLVLSGNLVDAAEDEHYVRSSDGKAGLWFGNVDDLFAMGIPRGQGGPWKDTQVYPYLPSAPYLMAGYDNKVVQLSHSLNEDVEITIQVDFLATGSWEDYLTITVPAGQTVEHVFPEGYAAHWVRTRANKACTATVWFIYNPLTDN